MNVRIYLLWRNPWIFERMNIFVNKYSNIIKYLNICYTLSRSIFYWKFDHWICNFWKIVTQKSAFYIIKSAVKMTKSSKYQYRLNKTSNWYEFNITKLVFSCSLTNYPMWPLPCGLGPLPKLPRWPFWPIWLLWWWPMGTLPWP